MGRADQPERAGLRGTEPAESGTEGSKSERRIMGRGTGGEEGSANRIRARAAGGRTEGEREARREPPRTEGPHGGGGGAGKPRPAARNGGAAHSPLCSPRNTSLNFLSGFPKSPPADMMEPEKLPPPQPRDLPDRRCSNRLTKRLEEGPAPSSLGPCRARRRSKAGEQGSSTQTDSRRRRLPSESPST